MSVRSFALEVLQRMIVKVTRDAGAVQTMQLEGERLGEESDVVEFESMLPYGLAAHPPAGSEAIVGVPDGDSGQAVVLTAQHRKHRPRDLKEGEVGLHYLGEIKIFLDKDGEVHVGAREGAEQAVLGESLKAWLEAMTVPTPFGPSGTPINAPDLPNVLSQIVRMS